MQGLDATRVSNCGPGHDPGGADGEGAQEARWR